MEVMGLMLGSFVDDYTITCVDVFAMPQVCHNDCYDDTSQCVIELLFEPLFVTYIHSYSTGLE